MTQPAISFFTPVCGTYPSAHCFSPAYWAVYYGLFTAIVPLLLVVFGGRSGEPGADREARSFHQRLVLLLGALFCWGLFLTDFVPGPTLPWIMTRFTEVPYYAMFLVLPIGIAQCRSATTRAVLAGLLLTWAIVPFVVNHGPAQLAANLAYLRRIL
jgi:hypothetical protein